MIVRAPQVNKVFCLGGSAVSKWVSSVVPAGGYIRRKKASVEEFQQTSSKRSGRKIFLDKSVFLAKCPVQNVQQRLRRTDAFQHCEDYKYINLVD